MTDTSIPSWADAPEVTPAPSWADQPVPVVDKYRQAAIAEADRLKSLTPPGVRDVQSPTGYTDRAAKPFGMGWRDDIAAGAMVPFEMIRQGTINPAEAYRYTRARETLNQERLAERTAGLGGALAEGAGIAGSVGNFAGSGTRAAAAAIPGTVAAKVPAPVMNALANTGRGALYGGIQGAGDAPTIDQMAGNALVGGALGGAAGFTLPIAVKSLSGVAGAAQLPRLQDPTRIAVQEVAEVARRAGVTPDEILKQLQAAKAAGQPFTVADALANEGQRKLTALVTVPGAQRERIADLLSRRDINMSERVGGQIGRSMGAPESAKQATENLIAKSEAEARPYFKKAEEQTGAIWNDRIAEGVQNPDIRKGIRFGTKIQETRASMTGQPAVTKDPAIVGYDEAGDPIIKGVPNFRTLQTTKIGLDSMIAKETDPVTGKMTQYGGALVGLKNRLSEQIANFRPDYATANKLFSDPIRIAEAVKLGQQMPGRGRAVDNVRAYERMNPPEQQGIRIGVADDLQRRLEQRGTYPDYLREKSFKGQTELEALQPHGPNTLQEFLKREEIMKETSHKALGGSQTANKLADVADTPSASAIFGVGKDLATGNYLGAVKSAGEMVKEYGKGHSEVQRDKIAKMLLMRDPKEFEKLIDKFNEYDLRSRGVNPFANRPPRYAP